MDVLLEQKDCDACSLMRRTILEVLLDQDWAGEIAAKNRMGARRARLLCFD